MRKMLIAGHRGNPTDYAENTMPSFQSAVDLGVDMIETDIHMTKDGRLVLIHDPSLDRTTDGHGLVRDKTLSEIRRCNAAAKEGGTARIPTLDEFLDEFERYPLRLLLAVLFLEHDIVYTWDTYQKHLALTKQYAKTHGSYSLKISTTPAFRNIQIQICEGKWAVISKSNSPAIHFVIEHKKLRHAIENM